jgi:hypothetical protein
MRKLIVRACHLDDGTVIGRGNSDDVEIVQELSKLLASGGPEAQRVIFDNWSLYRSRASAVVIAALADYYRDHPLHESASAAAMEAIPTVVDAAVMRRLQPGTPPYIVLARMAQRPELMQRVIDRMSRSGGGREIGGILKASGDEAEIVKRLHDSAASSTLPVATRAKAIRNLMLLGSERATATLLDIASGADPAVTGAELAPIIGTRRTADEAANDANRQVRECALGQLEDLHRDVGRRNPKDIADLEGRMIPVVAKIVATTRQPTLRARALYSLSEFGVPGKLAIVELYERETDPTRAREIGERLVHCNAYPRALLNEAASMTGSDARAFRAAAVHIMRLAITDQPNYADALLRVAEDARADAALRRQATAALFEMPDRRLTSEAVERLLASQYPEVAGATAVKSLSRYGTRMLTPEIVRTLLDSPVASQRDVAIRQTFPPYRRGQLSAEVALPLLNSKYPEVAAGAARALYADDALRKSVGIDTARRIGVLMGVQTVDHIVTSTTPHPAWQTNLPLAPPTMTPPTNGLSRPEAAADDVTIWLWRLTWWPAGLLIAAVVIIYHFAMLTVPEPRVAIMPGDV